MEAVMFDVLYIAITILFFAIAGAYVAACDRLRAEAPAATPAGASAEREARARR
jgi:hypothetical protein